MQGHTDTFWQYCESRSDFTISIGATLASNWTQFANAHLLHAYVEMDKVGSNRERWIVVDNSPLSMAAFQLVVKVIGSH